MEKNPGGYNKTSLFTGKTEERETFYELKSLCLGKIRNTSKHSYVNPEYLTYGVIFRDVLSEYGYIQLLS